MMPDYLALEEGFFDLIVSNLGVNNFPRPDAVLAKCRRVLASGGALALTTNFEGHMREFYDVFDSTLSEMSLEGERGRLAEHIQPARMNRNVEFRIETVADKVNGRRRFVVDFGDGGFGEDGSCNWWVWGV